MCNHVPWIAKYSDIIHLYYYHLYFSIQILMLLFRFISESPGFSSDFTQKCKTAIEIGTPFDDVWQFSSFVVQNEQ